MTGSPTKTRLLETAWIRRGVPLRRTVLWKLQTLDPPPAPLIIVCIFHRQPDSLWLKFAAASKSKEAHERQRILVQERKAAKPNADLIYRSKKIWERLRRKSHVPPDERKELVAELFGIVTGRIKDFVFKHDSVRVVQTALKYANQDQRKTIARELEGSFKQLGESKYAKFLISKLLVHG